MVLMVLVPQMNLSYQAWVAKRTLQPWCSKISFEISSHYIYNGVLGMGPAKIERE